MIATAKGYRVAGTLGATGKDISSIMKIAPYLALLIPIFAASCLTPHSGGQSTAVTASKPATPLSVYLRRTQLTGTWFGDQSTKSGGRRQWLMTRRNDGTFIVRFHTRDKVEGDYEGTEFGIWGVTANYLVTLTQGSVDPDGTMHQSSSANAYFWDLYEIQSLTNDDFVYLSIETKNKFHTKKVPADFTFSK